jgi:LemA protein
MLNVRRIALVAVLAAGTAGCGVNTIPAKEEAAKAKWADVQNQYQRRADLIPNLVSSVKGAAANERGTLTAVTEARAKATQIQLTGDQLRDPEAMKRFAEAQGEVSRSILQVRQLQEAYPDLKTNENFLQLQAQLEGTENRISVARRDYNASVQDYNTTIRQFPTAITAKVFYGAKPLTPFQATTPSADQAPKVSF